MPLLSFKRTLSNPGIIIFILYSWWLIPFSIFYFLKFEFPLNDRYWIDLISMILLPIIGIVLTQIDWLKISVWPRISSFVKGVFILGIELTIWKLSPILSEVLNNLMHNDVTCSGGSPLLLMTLCSTILLIGTGVICIYIKIKELLLIAK